MRELVTLQPCLPAFRSAAQVSAAASLPAAAVKFYFSAGSSHYTNQLSLGFYLAASQAGALWYMFMGARLLFENIPLPPPPQQLPCGASSLL